MIINNDDWSPGCASRVVQIPSSRMRGKALTEGSSSLLKVTQLGRTSSADPRRRQAEAALGGHRALCVRTLLPPPPCQESPVQLRVEALTSQATVLCPVSKICKLGSESRAPGAFVCEASASTRQAQLSLAGPEGCLGMLGGVFSELGASLSRG